jgi:hypothetical protein
VNESLDALIWREHAQWLEDRARIAVERERWTDDDWAAARLAADVAWDAHRSNIYLYDAERALREHHYSRVQARLAVEARFGVEWLLGVLERTALPARKPRPCAYP